MTAPSQPAFTDLSIFPEMSEAEYLPVRGVYMYQNPLEDYSASYPYHSPDFSMTNAPFDPNPQMTSRNKSTVEGWPMCNAAPFGVTGDLCNAFTTTELFNRGALRTPPMSTHGGAGPDTQFLIPGCSPPSDISSPTFRELESPRSQSVERHSDGEYTAETAPRKRGRPRHSRTHTDPTNKSSSPNRARRAACLPHKQVERKYREGLNMEFERLRRAIPTLPQSTDANIMGVAKPSKGMVLGAAIEYINRIERERDEALDEVQRLGGNVRMTRRRP